MPDGRPLANAVDAQLDQVALAPGLDHGPAGVAVEDERDRDDRLERVALRTSGRADVGLATSYPDAEVEDVLDHVGGDAGAVVLDRDPGAVERDRDRRRGARLLAGVDRVIEELLQDHHRPGLLGVADLGGELLLGREVEQPRLVRKVARSRVAAAFMAAPM